MKRWPIERSWVMLAGEEGHSSLRTSELRKFQACVLLGAAGLGKTYELSHLASFDHEQGLDVRIERLAVLGQSAESLERGLKRLTEQATESTVIYLDALDEAMVPIRTAGRIVERWVRNELPSVRFPVRISCRSAVWPSSLTSAIQEVFGKEQMGIASLQILAQEDVRRVATQHDVDADRFWSEVSASRAEVLTQQPLTLDMLLRVFKANQQLPERRSELFKRGVEILANERSDRWDEGTAIDIPVGEMLEAAERLACYTLLSGREIIDLGDHPEHTSFGVMELGNLPSAGLSLDRGALNAIRRCGLCEGDGDRRFRFAHRQFAEYLAGRRLASLPLHQARAILASGLGWEQGVAGPLRETAAFAAMLSDEIAEWIAEVDPEVIGLSDVVDNGLRRLATLALIDRFRRHEMTYAQLLWGGIELKGFQYSNAENDLSAALSERHEGCEDVLECAIKLIETWELRTMSDHLATFILDPTAPLHSRARAGYVLAELGTSEARLRLRPLLTVPDDGKGIELKGIALQCLWPDHVTVAEVLATLTQARDRGRHNSYDHFLTRLDRECFDAPGCRSAGMAWAARFVHLMNDHDPAVRIGKRTAIAALQELNEPETANALVRLMLACAVRHASSPLIPPQEYGAKATATPAQPVLVGQHEVRRLLLDAIAAEPINEDVAFNIVRTTPALSVIEDFEWLLDRATAPEYPEPQRHRYLLFAQMLSWSESSECVDAWLRRRHLEPIASKMDCPLVMDTKGEQADKAREMHTKLKRWSTPEPAKRVEPAPSERVRRELIKCEKKGSQHFPSLALQLTLEEYSTQYDFTTYLKETPGWKAASESTQTRIVAAARQFLTIDHDELKQARTSPLNSILWRQNSAMFLVMDQDREWVDTLPVAWWRKWAWYFLRELHPRMAGEAPEPKYELLGLLYRKVPQAVRAEVHGLTISIATETKNLCSSLVEALRDIPDSEFDEMLCASVQNGQIPEDRFGEVAAFILNRIPERAVPVCISLLDNQPLAVNEPISVRAAVALLCDGPAESWEPVFDLLRRRADLAKRILGSYAYGCRYHSNRDPDDPRDEPMSVQITAQLFEQLLLAYPPEHDPDHGGEAHTVTIEDESAHLRDQLINWLRDQRSAEAVQELLHLEEKYGARYPWLRHYRAQAERAYRMANWTPIEPQEIAEILVAKDKRLVRNGKDALGGVIAAVEAYGRTLGPSGGGDVEDLWNIPHGVAATLRKEERLSEKLSAAIHAYFADYAIVTGREVQVARRLVPEREGGAPGSEVDVLFTVPSANVASGSTIKVPIEVKLSKNAEAATGLNDQLVDRYMSELSTPYGVYVVAWVGANKAARHKSAWATIEKARADLALRAQEAMKANSGFDVRVVVIDVTLPMVTNTKRKSSTASRKEKPRASKSRSSKPIKKKIEKRTKAKKKKRGERKPSRTPARPASKTKAAKPRSGRKAKRTTRRRTVKSAGSKAKQLKKKPKGSAGKRSRR